MSSLTFLDDLVLEDAGIVEITCQLSLRMFQPFAPEPSELSAAAKCSSHPGKNQNNVAMLVLRVYLEMMNMDKLHLILRTVPLSSLATWSF